MATTDRSIVTLNQLKDVIGMNRQNTSKDDMLEEWIDWVSGKFEDDIGDVVKVIEKTVYLDGSGDQYLYLPFHPIVALYGDSASARLASLQYRSNTADATYTNLVSDEDYIHIDTEDSDKIELLGSVPFYLGQKNIKVHYWAGYSSVPGSIRIAVLEALQMMWNNSKQGGDRLGKSSMSSSSQAGSSSEAYFDVTPRWREAVRRYKSKVHNVECFR
jgi:hypothetical protein